MFIKTRTKACIKGRDFQYVPYEGLSEELARIQEVKIAFFEKFWGPSGKGAVRALAAEVGPFS